MDAPSPWRRHHVRLESREPPWKAAEGAGLARGELGELRRGVEGAGRAWGAAVGARRRGRGGAGPGSVCEVGRRGRGGPGDRLRGRGRAGLGGACGAGRGWGGGGARSVSHGRFGARNPGPREPPGSRGAAAQ